MSGSGRNSESPYCSVVTCLQVRDSNSAIEPSSAMQECLSRRVSISSSFTFTEFDLRISSLQNSNLNGSWSIAIHWDAHMIWSVTPSVFRLALLLCPLINPAWLELLHRKEPVLIILLQKYPLICGCVP